eukprot:366558-Chlamydomonas_euryale.AAC.2
MAAEGHDTGAGESSRPVMWRERGGRGMWVLCSAARHGSEKADRARGGGGARRRQSHGWERDKGVRRACLTSRLPHAAAG